MLARKFAVRLENRQKKMNLNESEKVSVDSSLDDILEDTTDTYDFSLDDVQFEQWTLEELIEKLMNEEFIATWIITIENVFSEDPEEEIRNLKERLDSIYSLADDITSYVRSVQDEIDSITDLADDILSEVDY